uniref:E3 ubiquitin-protein ligase TRIM39-like n=1 Tax=Labrus bergylta TaxID=56723 RepID=A0A3Q3GTV3_9LABR
MSAASCMLSEEQFLCSICLDVFTDPVSIPCGHNFCKSCITYHWDVNAPCQCPLCSKVFNRRPELHVNTFISEMAAQFRQSTVKKSSRMSLKENTNSGEVLCDKIQKRRLKIEKIRQSVKLSREDTDREKSDSVQVFTALIRSVEEGLAQLLNLLEEKQKTTEEKAEGFIKELEDEISELMERNTEVEQLLSTEDHLQSAVAQLEEKLSEEVEKQLESELMRIQQYAVDITLDPDTAHPFLILSDDGKQVYYGKRKKRPDNPERFSEASVLGKQSICAGKFYFEVEVKNKSKWDLGVARGSINRKEPISPRLKTGPWFLMLRNGGEYKAVGVLLSLKSKPQKVGVFVDYEEGVVSFYDVDAAALIYSFTGCNFTEKLFPIFSPCLDDRAPLIITPVSK